MPMKYFLRLWLFDVFALWVVTNIFPALRIVGGWQSIFVSGLILAVLMLIVKPILKILFIPINFLTFGLLSWFVNVIVIYVLTLLAPSVAISAWTFPGATWSGFVIPAVSFSYLASIIIATICITCIVTFLEEITN